MTSLYIRYPKRQLGFTVRFRPEETMYVIYKFMQLNAHVDPDSIVIKDKHGNAPPMQARIGTFFKDGDSVLIS